MEHKNMDFQEAIKADAYEVGGKLFIEYRETKWNGKGIKWFDDNLLLKKNHNK